MAQLSVERKMEVKAPAAKIWEQLMDVASWPEWKPFVPKARIASGYDSLTCGAKLKMSIVFGGAASIPLSVTISEFDKPSRLAWEGGAKGLFHAVHGFELKDQGGSTLVTSREDFSGVLLPVVNLIVTKEDLEKLHEQWLLAIKKRMEGEPEQEADASDHGH
jgi:hypothetical protein